MSTYEKIKKVFSDKLDLDESKISPDTKLENLNLDSLDKIEFLFALDDEFGITIPHRGIKLDTVQDVIDAVERLVSEKEAGAAAGKV